MSQERKRKLNLNKREVATQRSIITNLWFCGGAVNLRARPITVNQKPQIICCFFAGDASVWIKAPSLKKKGRKQYVYPRCGKQQSSMYTSLPFDSLCKHMFSISVWSVSEMCDTRRESRVSGGRAYVRRWTAKRCLLWPAPVVDTSL